MALTVTAIEYCFSHENSDGSFQVVQIPGASFALNTDPIVGTVFFYADLGHALALMQQSSWFQTGTATAPLRQRIDSLRLSIGVAR